MRPDSTPSRHLWLAVAAMLLVRAFDTLPRGLVVNAATATPWVTLLAGLMAFLFISPVMGLLARLPGRNLNDLALSVGGRPLALVGAFIAMVVVVATAAIDLRLVSEMAVSAIFPHTPQTFLMSALLLVAVIGARLSPSSLVWMGVILFWPLLIGLVLVLVGNVGWGEFSELLPLAGHGVIPSAAALPRLSSYFGELALLGVFSSQLSSPRRLLPEAALIAGLVALVWGLITLVYLMVYPYPGGTALPFPVYDMTRLIQGGRFLERLDGLWVTSWAFGTAFRLAMMFMGAALLYRDAFRLPCHRMVVLPMAVAVLAVSLLPPNQYSAIMVDTHLLNRWGFLFSLILPAALALTAYMRGERHHA